MQKVKICAELNYEEPNSPIIELIFDKTNKTFVTQEALNRITRFLDSLEDPVEYDISNHEEMFNTYKHFLDYMDFLIILDLNGFLINNEYYIQKI